jgi:isopentenyl-diphosphate delta-isomerase
MKQHIRRKEEHVEICSTMDVEAKISAGWEDIHFFHQCLPEIDREEISLRANFCGQRLEHPLVISALTGGYPEAAGINQILGRAAEHFGLIMEVGSQRPMVAFPEMAGTYSTAREAAPHAFIAANIGAAQLIAQKGGANYTLEQIKGRARGCTEAIGRIASSIAVPLIVKETGAGISKSQALQLKSRGVAALDIGGAGGTSMALVESHRAASHQKQGFQRLGQTFADWGIPTAISIVEARSSGLPIIASGGIRNGLDAAKALALGANLVGIGRPLLSHALTKGYDGVIEWLEVFFDELSVAMFLAAAATIEELNQKRLIITGKTKDWLEQLGYDLPQLTK